MVAAIDTRDLIERALAGFHRRVIPGQVRRGGVRARGQQRHDRRVVPATADFRVVAQGSIIDIGHQIAFADTRLDLLEDTFVHASDDPARDAHIVQFGLGFDRPLPVHQRVGIGELSVWHVLLE
ncbi:hypothetical protein ROA7745_04661 [Roseovarius aestuarii]|uniref:Uncharacterized protein n=1 Tax=Roseovarius aestuarii TaxID=475083 RepID=A0A1X7BYV7_9RHOB|nr:hypothetical protein ROA7745_04661 [Roseovarius aestuarii]